MFVLRFVALLFLVCYSWSMGQYPPASLNGFGTVSALSFFVFAPALYLLPTYEASRNGSENVPAIALLNVFLGWSLLGWVAALVWAFRKPAPMIVEAVHHAPPVQQADAGSTAATKKCPYCAEEVLLAAIKCKHCGSSIVVAASTVPSA
jgi:hypothetical protein